VLRCLPVLWARRVSALPRCAPSFLRPCLPFALPFSPPVVRRLLFALRRCVAARSQVLFAVARFSHRIRLPLPLCGGCCSAVHHSVACRLEHLPVRACSSLDLRALRLYALRSRLCHTFAGAYVAAFICVALYVALYSLCRLLFAAFVVARYICVNSAALFVASARCRSALQHRGLVVSFGSVWLVLRSVARRAVHDLVRVCGFCRGLNDVARSLRFTPLALFSVCLPFHFAFAVAFVSLLCVSFDLVPRCLFVAFLAWLRLPFIYCCATLPFTGTLIWICLPLLLPLRAARLPFVRLRCPRPARCIVRWTFICRMRTPSCACALVLISLPLFTSVALFAWLQFCLAFRFCCTLLPGACGLQRTLCCVRVTI